MQALRIYGDVWDNLINSLSTSLSSLVQLSELELDILPEDVDGVWLAGVDSIMTKLLESAVHLKTLHIRCDYEGTRHKYLGKVFTTISKMRLEKITLTYVDLDLYNPFKNRMDSLRHLGLTGCQTDKSVEHVLLSIQQNLPRLEYLRLSDMPGAWLSDQIELEGVQGVNEGIDKLIQSKRD